MKPLLCLQLYADFIAGKFPIGAKFDEAVRREREILEASSLTAANERNETKEYEHDAC